MQGARQTSLPVRYRLLDQTGLKEYHQSILIFAPINAEICWYLSHLGGRKQEKYVKNLKQIQKVAEFKTKHC